MHIVKYKHSQVGGNLLAHIERTRGDSSKYGNENIDPKRSHLNYDLSEGHKWTDDYHKGYDTGKDYRDKWDKLQKEQKRKTRTDAVGLASVIVTIPERYKELPPHQQAEFFECCHNFLHQQFGCRDNEIYSSVHMDETSPHLHYGFIPVDEDRQVNAKKVLDRRTFQKLHGQLDSYLDEKLPFYHGGILLETLERGRDYVSIDKLKDQPLLYRDAREVRNVLEDAVASNKGKHRAKYNKAQQIAIERALAMSSGFAYNLEIAEDVARQRYHNEYEGERLEARKNLLDTRELAVNEQWGLARKERDELKQEKKKVEELWKKVKPSFQKLEEMNRQLEQENKTMKKEIEIKDKLLRDLAISNLKENPEARTKELQDVIDHLREEGKGIRKSEVFKQKKNKQELGLSR